MDLINADFQCAFCGALNPTTVDPSAGRRQAYVEDCQTCCRPNALQIEIESGDQPFAYIEAERES